MTDKTYEQILALELARQCGASIFKSNNGDRLYTTVIFDIDELQVFADLTAAQPVQPAAPYQVPDGWQLVPVEPTQEMLKAGVKEQHGTATYKCVALSGISAMEGDQYANYAAMLAAAPKGTS